MTRLKQEHYDILLKQLKDMHNAIMSFHASTTDKDKTDEQNGEEDTGFRIEYLPCPDEDNDTSVRPPRIRALSFHLMPA